MQIYLVGGAVRDELLELPVGDKDYVVVGATVDEMLKLRYRQVGKDFPVFLHPETHEEYALARKERKTAPGYTGFAFDASASVTLEEDLSRRDLTINAIAKSEDGKIIDPYHGREDIKNKILRHVSPAFVEDPVRILRAARFAARFAYLGFTVAKETTVLMQEMVKAGEVDALVSERVWKEWEKALQEKNPEVFFEVLESCGALRKLFPNFTERNREQLKRVSEKIEDLEVRFASLVFCLPVEAIKLLCNNYRVPNAFQELAVLVMQKHEVFLNALNLDSADDISKLFKEVDAFRRPERFQKFLIVSSLLKSGFAVQVNIASVQLNDLFEVVRKVSVKDLDTQGLSNEAIGKCLEDERKRVIREML